MCIPLWIPKGDTSLLVQRKNQCLINFYIACSHVGSLPQRHASREGAVEGKAAQYYQVVYDPELDPSRARKHPKPIYEFMTEEVGFYIVLHSSYSSLWCSNSYKRLVACPTRSSESARQLWQGDLPHLSRSPLPCVICLRQTFGAR